MSGDGRPLSVRLHEKAGHLEAFAPATAQDFHELADEVAALEAEKPLAEGFAHTEVWYDLPGQNKVVWVIKPQRSLDTDIGVIILPAKAPQRELCPNCYGTGIYDDQTCTFCDGERYVVLSAEEEAADA